MEILLAAGALVLGLTMLYSIDVFEDGIVGIIDAWRRVWRWNVAGFLGVWRTLARLVRDGR